MQVLGGLLSLGAVGLACSCLICGLANTIDWIAWRLHKTARHIRELHARQSATMNERWVRELER